MNKVLKLGFVLIFCITFLTPNITWAVSPTLITFPEKIQRGDPVMITVVGLTKISEVKEITFDGIHVPVFLYSPEGKQASNGAGKKVTAFIGVDLRKKPGNYNLKVKLTNGQTLEKVITVLEREKVEEPLGIPEKLGGNTTASQNNLIAVLATENSTLNNLYTGKKAFWTESFHFPLSQIFVTDPYGYSRETGAYTIPHKGTDFRASEGTPVMAMNRGVVRIARTGISYGKTIVVDHGLGLQTFYLHLSKIKVNVGELVLPGQIIGLSGQTGYTDAPHLHLSIRLNGVSIDPMKFMEFFK